MAWGGFIIALLLAFVLQTGVAAPLSVPHFDAFLVLALLCGLLCPTPDARIAGWIVGLVQDLSSADALGIHAFTLGLTVLLLTRIRELGNVSVWWVRAPAALLAAWPPQFIYLLHLRYWAGHTDESFGGLVLSAALTALVAAVLAMLINALPGMMQRKRRRFRTSRG